VNIDDPVCDVAGANRDCRYDYTRRGALRRDLARCRSDLKSGTYEYLSQTDAELLIFDTDRPWWPEDRYQPLARI
jgi:hypothetical protein